jgi:hypothetical protein
MADTEWPWLWGYDNGSIYYGPGDGKNDKRIQDSPELFAKIKELCREHFYGTSDERECDDSS